MSSPFIIFNDMLKWVPADKSDIRDTHVKKAEELDFCRKLHVCNCFMNDE